MWSSRRWVSCCMADQSSASVTARVFLRRTWGSLSGRFVKKRRQFYHAAPVCCAARWGNDRAASGLPGLHAAPGIAFAGRPACRSGIALTARWLIQAGILRVRQQYWTIRSNPGDPHARPVSSQTAACLPAQVRCQRPLLAEELTLEEQSLLAASYGDKASFSLATGSLSSLRRAPAVGTVITAEDIAAMGATDLDEVWNRARPARGARLTKPINRSTSCAAWYSQPTNPQIPMLQ